VKVIDLKEAQGRTWDCIAVGSSFAATYFVQGLASRKPLDVLFVERGAMVSHADQIQDPSVRVYERFSQTNTGPRPKTWVAMNLFGGNSNCWYASTPRLHPNDFRTGSLYGVDVDWPLTYADLEPWYEEVEVLMDVSGGGSDSVLPRRRPFPAPPHEPTPADVIMRRTEPGLWWAQPTARSNGGKRARCCGNAICHLCPVEAKYTILNGLPDLHADRASCLTHHEVRRVSISAGRADGVVVRSPQGGEFTLKAGMVALGANAISNTAILMRSGVTHPKLGRGLNEQAAQSVAYSTPFPNYFGGTITTGHGYRFYDGSFRKDRAPVLMEIANDLRHVTGPRGKWLNQMRIHFISGDRVQDRNRVVLKDDEPHIEWAGYDSYAERGIAEAIKSFTRDLPFKGEMRLEDADLRPTESHIQGMTVMGATAAEGVVDPDCALYGTGGVYVVGSSVFPTCAPANPTLTLSAVALRAGTRAT